MALDYNGFTGTQASVTCNPDGTLQNPSLLPVNLTYPNNYYDFKEWNTKPDGTGDTVTSSYNFRENAVTTIYAVWQYHIKYNYDVDKDDDNSDPTASKREFVTIDYIKGLANQYMLADPPTRTGYHATGWAELGSDRVTWAIDRTGETPTAPATASNLNSESATSSTKELHLIQVVNHYKIKYHPNNPDQEDSVAYNQDAAWNDTFALTAFNPATFKYFGHHFSTAGWNTEPDGTGTDYADKASARHNLSAEDGATVDLYAQWTADTYRIEIAPGNATGEKWAIASYQFGQSAAPVWEHDGANYASPDANVLSKATLGYTNTGFDYTQFNIVYLGADGEPIQNYEHGSGNPTGDVCAPGTTALDALCPGDGNTASLTPVWTLLAPYTITYVGYVHKSDYSGPTLTTDVRWYKDGESNKAGYPATYDMSRKEETINLPDPDTRSGYTFIGWEVESDGMLATASTAGENGYRKALAITIGNGTNGDGSAGTYGNLTLTAHWKADTNDIVYYRNFGANTPYEGESGQTPVSYEVGFDDGSTGKQVTIGWVPERNVWYAGNTFAGWTVTLPGEFKGGKTADDCIANNGTTSVTVTVGEDWYTGDIVCTAIWHHVQLAIEAPVTVNFFDRYESDAYDINNSDNERTYVETEAVFKSYAGQSGSSHDFVISKVECRNDVGKAADDTEFGGARRLLASGKTASTDDTTGKTVYTYTPLTDEDKPFWISTTSTVDLATGQNKGDVSKRRFFGVDASIESAKGDFGESEFYIHVSDEDDGDSKTQTVKPEGASEPVTEKWHETTFYYGLDLKRFCIDPTSVAADLNSGVSRVYPLVKLVFTFAPVPN